MYTNFDYEEEQEAAENRIINFFGEFSSEVRNKLISKNLVKPQSLYDIFYPSTRENLLSKNANLFNTDLEEFSKDIRDAQLSKAVDRTFSLEEQSEDFRKAMLARETMHKDADSKMEQFEKVRKNLISKNVPSLSDLMKDSEQQRRFGLARNVPNANFDKKLDDSQSQYREENLIHNSAIEQDLDQASTEHRKDNLSKNDANESNLEQLSESFREKDLSLNIIKTTNIEESSVDYRKEDLFRNIPNQTDLSTLSEDLRNTNLAKNISENSDLELDSLQFRKQDLSNNANKQTDLETDSKNFRKDELSLNTPQVSNIEKDSELFRQSDLSNNISKEMDLQKFSENFRDEDLKLNNGEKTDLEKNSLKFRETQLSNNTQNKSNLEEDSISFLKNGLSNNGNKVTNLEADSQYYVKNNLSGNVLKETSLEKESESLRAKTLSSNIENKTDLEKDSETYRVNDLFSNVLNKTNLEENSIEFRKSDLSVNSPNTTDLEKDSIYFRVDDLKANVPNVTNLETDSVSFRENDLKINVPKTTNLETDSVEFRENGLASNIPGTKTIDGHIDELGQINSDDNERNRLISKNVESKYSIDSFIDELGIKSSDDNERNRLVAKNVESKYSIDNFIDELGIKSSDDNERNRLVAKNVESKYSIDNFIDELGIKSSDDNERAHLISKNVESKYSIDNFIDELGIKSSDDNERAHLISKNVDLNQTIDNHINGLGVRSSGENELGYNLSKNNGSQQSIDSHVNLYGQYSGGADEREKLTSRNESIGQPWIEILGPGGTATYIGISGVFTQALVFRPMLTMKNKYYDTTFKSRYYKEADASNFGLLSDTLTVPTEVEINEGLGLPMNTRFSINEKVENFAEITSPIQRNLTYAYYSADAQIQFLKYYSIFSNTNIKKVNIDYDLDNTQTIHTSYGLKKRMDFELPTENINNLIRLYLKYSNPSSLGEGGKLITNTPDQNVSSIFSRINAFAQSPDGKSIQDLINGYELFSQERLNKILKTSSKSLNSPNGPYLIGNAEILENGDYGNIDDPNIIFKKYAGNPLHDAGFDNKSKGVRYILQRAANSSADFNINYQYIQGTDGEKSKSYVIGRGGNGTPKMGYQKYTIKNPYAPDRAAKMIFGFKNYSNNQTMYFPPYINSFSNSDGASWNAVNFLGRPEAVYTYNNSSRDGSISFTVLTDYAQKVYIGTEQNKDMNPISVDINKNFSTDAVINAGTLVKGLASIVNDINNDTKSKNENKKNENVSNGQDMISILNTTESGTTANDANERKLTKDLSGTHGDDKVFSYSKLVNSIDKTIEEEATQPAPNYSESSPNYKNINNLLVGDNQIDSGYIDTKAVDTKKRIDEMIKSLAFQPAYFSGSKADFKNRMEFLAKMTRPANNTNDMTYDDNSGKWKSRGGGIGGFSFTKPPICHLMLGDWINHDIVVNSVSYDYSNAPWTDGLDDNIVQPMWAVVTVSFNIVGGAGDSGGVPLTSTDREGFFGTKTVR